ncbi:integrase arm-type DNA-binding domain-containing protein [uncultured Pseudomonas sp.]|uniref:tyrosine-type recombinase/integrase n=1 Tax=uncultured Pseudomonas sp. TaxID=114707 RepID=UPI0025836E83|nr:integrase arm-type DNA-binding domain-containing protein [uncultured Pseudomonas sp.]
MPRDVRHRPHLLRRFPNGRKRWELRYKKPSGKWSFMGLGGYPEVSAKKAREKAGQAIAMIGQGVDPVEKKADDAQADARSLRTTFRAAAEAWFAKKSDEGLAKGTLDKVRTYLDKDILPALGDKQLDEITRRDCAELQRSFEQRDAHNVAKKAGGWLNKIFSFAIASGMTENNPASELLVVAAPAPKTQQYPHLLEPELPEFMRAMRRSTSRLIARTSAWMTLWTASRPGMVRYANGPTSTWMRGSGRYQARR